MLSRSSMSLHRHSNHREIAARQDTDSRQVRTKRDKFATTLYTESCKETNNSLLFVPTMRDITIHKVFGVGCLVFVKSLSGPTFLSTGSFPETSLAFTWLRLNYHPSSRGDFNTFSSFSKIKNTPC